MPGVTSALIADPMAAAGRAPVWRGAQRDVDAALAGSVRAGDLVVTMGAGDITKASRALLARLQASA